MMIFFGSAALYILESGYDDEYYYEENVAKKIMQYSRWGELDSLKKILNNYRFHIDDTFEGKTALHNAAKEGKLGVVKYLIEQKNASFEIKSDVNITALEYATYQGNFNIVKYLIAQGANISNNMMYLSVYSGNLELIKYSVENLNCDILAKTKNGDNMLSVANKNLYFSNRTKVLLYLAARGADVDQLPNNEIIKIQKSLGKLGHLYQSLFTLFFNKTNEDTQINLFKIIEKSYSNKYSLTNESLDANEYLIKSELKAENYNLLQVLKIYDFMANQHETKWYLDTTDASSYSRYKNLIELFIERNLLSLKGVNKSGIINQKFCNDIQQIINSYICDELNKEYLEIYDFTQNHYFSLKTNSDIDYISNILDYFIEQNIDINADYFDSFCCAIL